MAISTWQRGLAALAAATTIVTGASSAQAILSVGEVQFHLIGRYETGIYTNGDGAAEIVAHDPVSQRLFVVNGIAKTIDVLDISNPTTPTLIAAISMAPFGNTANSVAVKNGIVAIAVEAVNKQANGQAVFFNANDATFDASINSITVGALPDMITFTPDGKKVFVANEGEPNSYNQIDSVDPLGSVSIIDISTGVASATVSHTDFTAFNGQEAALRAQGVRIYGPNASAAQDLEPEYIAISPDGSKAYVTLQENNAIAIINVATGTIDKIVALGYKDHSLPGNGLDLSDRDGPGNAVKLGNIINAPVFGMYQPDGIATFEVGGKTFLITANEGDAREYTGFEEEARINDISNANLDPSLQFLKSSNDTNRLTVTTAYGRTTDDGGGTNATAEFDRLYALGARSFTIWDDQGVLVFDSGDQFEQILKQLLPNDFNSTHNAGPSADNRSDNKGPEPESVTISILDDRIFAFIGLERIGGIMVYDVTDPSNPFFAGYANSRIFGATYNENSFPNAALLSSLGDLGPEGLIFISAADSPTGRAMIVTANEVSGTIAIFGVAIIPEPATSMLGLAGLAALGLRRRRG